MRKLLALPIILILGLSACWGASENPEPTPTETAITPTDEPTPGGTSTSPGEAGADPNFSSCIKAVENGYGPYSKDDLEYTYYEDRDGDGIVCE